MTLEAVVIAAAAGLTYFGEWWHTACVTPVLFAFYVVLMVLSQDSLIYNSRIRGTSCPASNPPGFRSPAEHRLQFEDVTLTSLDGTVLHGKIVQARR
mmetsp:Transcript_23784/g.53981  ORF Transcript_23784/g.53981 Transcript_23784/m.53981 type:complete len:97 (-) Transcript_23784:325-615(-)